MIPSTTSRLKMRLDFSYGHPSDFSRGQSLLLHFLQVSVAGAMSSVNQLFHFWKFSEKILAING